MSHRASLPLTNNEFLIDTEGARVYSTALENTLPMTFLSVQDKAEIEYHRNNGFSPNCVICAQNARQPVDSATMREQLAALESSWTAEMSREAASELLEQMVSLQSQIDKLDDHADAWAFGRELLKDGPL